MATKKISELTALTTPVGTEQLVVEEAGGTSRKVRLDAITEYGLSAIDASISDTAKDVFVYDTSKDSDGGAWRKRTQGTSWYNETLNTSTRGSRKEFPAVAVIVAENGAVTIYDGDDPSLPMWMVFNVLNINGSNVSSSVFMNNGDLYIGRNIGVYRANLLSDKISSFTIYGESPLRYQTNISLRSEASNGATPDASRAIVNNTVNDIAVTVLPNAPIDSATGLPVPTIAVATNGGVSVIKDDGSVVDINGYGAAWTRIEWFEGDNFGAVRAGTGLYTFKLSNITDGVNENSVFISRYKSTFDSYGVPVLYNSSAVMFPTNTNGNLTVGNVSGVSVVKPNTTTPSNGSVAYITSDYNTGWMNGDIKLAALSDTDDTDVTGASIYSETFGSDTAGWAIDSGDGGGSLTWNSGGYLVVDRGTGDYVYAAYKTGLGWTTGKQYVLSFRVNPNNTGKLRVRCNTQQWDSTTLTANAWQTITINVTPTADRIEIGSEGGAGIDQFLLDDIYLYPAEEDRSVNGNGLQVHGTITKNPVATGADLVAYSGFSASNYLEQPYNSDLDFGTGDFSIMLWAKLATSDCTAIYTGTSSSNGINVWCYGTAIKIYVAGQFMSFSSTSYIGSNFAQFTMVRKSGVVSVYTNGELSVTVGAAGSIVYNTMKLGHGHYSGGGAVLALFRASATAPTAEQIAKIYEDEKPLFQENAKATLYGTSDAVTALAHDDSTNLLHVGTSAGRSVFQGLRRVDNTTDAVGSCISASNNLVVED